MDSVFSTDISQQTGSSRAWRNAVLIIGIALAVEVVAYWPTVTSALELWRTSSAYNYGYLIAPISLYLIWSDRTALRRLTPAISFVGLAVIVAFGLSWLAADLLGINEGRHLAFVGMMQGIFLFALGWRVYRRMIFALLYLWLMVPTGEFLNEPLQHVSLTGAVAVLRTVGIPVFTEGWAIQVSTGTFIVEPGCSGLNFILASLALSLLFGKMNYRRWQPRVLAIAISLVVAVLANIARIFLIVAITQWSHRRIDIADDHLLYGWIFFGIVMFILMWVGMRYADTLLAGQPEIPERPVRQTSLVMTLAGMGMVATILLAFPRFAAATGRPETQNAVTINLPENIGDWTADDVPQTSWRPHLARSDAAAQNGYLLAGRHIDVAVAYCAVQWSGGCEAASAENLPVDPESSVWKRATSQSHVLIVQGHPAGVQATELLDGTGRFVVSWYESSDCITVSRLQAKLCAARQRLTGRSATGAFVALSTDVGTDRAGALAALDAFAAQWPASHTFVRIVPK